MSTSLPPLQQHQLAHGTLAWREAGQGPAIVLLHGVGSGAASWVGQFRALSAHHRVIAWDAPGYGSSAPLAATQPMAHDYAQVLDEGLAYLGVHQALLVGHSLGAIVAASWAARHPARVLGWVLVSPARGYGGATATEQQARYDERIELATRLGMAGLAEQRAAALCTAQASSAVRSLIRDTMASISLRGYQQAVGMLTREDLLAHLRTAPTPHAVIGGELDRITPPQACEGVAQACGAPWVMLPGAPHACYVEQPEAFNAALAKALNLTLKKPSMVVESS
jgi:pimeloyl-ACP methyl ester carboxylesterase